MVLIIRDSLRVLLQISQTKFADDSLSNFLRFKQIVSWLDEDVTGICKKYSVECDAYWLKESI